MYGQEKDFSYYLLEVDDEISEDTEVEILAVL